MAAIIVNSNSIYQGSWPRYRISREPSYKGENESRENCIPLLTELRAAKFCIDVSLSLFLSLLRQICALLQTGIAIHNCVVGPWFIDAPLKSSLGTTVVPLASNISQILSTIPRRKGAAADFLTLLTMQIRIDNNRYRWHAGKQDLSHSLNVRVRDVRLHVRTRINCQPGPVVRIIHFTNVRRFVRSID